LGRGTAEDRRRRLVRQNRLIFALIGTFGLVFLLGGIVSLIRQI
jgi:hypothetical protein